MLTLGTARTDITPPLGLALSGWNAGRYGQHVHRPLEARALWLHNGQTTWVVVTLDILGLSAGLCRDIRGRIADRLDVSVEAVMLSGSHTHSGAVLPPWRPEGVDAADEAYVATLGKKIVGCVEEARRSLVPVTVGHGCGTCDLGVNRRLPWDHGKVAFPPHADPDGPADPEVGVLRFDDKAGEPVAILFSYGCHPTVGGTSTWIGPDYPGFARAVVEDAFPSAMAAFVLGNCGDVRSNYTNPDGSFRWNTTQELVEQAGRRVGSVVATVAGGVRTAPTSVLRLGRATRPVYLSDGSLVEHSEFLACRVGDAAVVSSPAECFSAIGLEVRKEAAWPVLFASVTNGFFGYVPTEIAHQLGGYEVELSWKSFGLSASVRPDAHHAFRDGMLAALTDCQEGAAS